MRQNWLSVTIPLEDIFNDYSPTESLLIQHGLDFMSVARDVVVNTVTHLHNGKWHLYQERPLGTAVELETIDPVMTQIQGWSKELDTIEFLLRGFIQRVYHRLTEWISMFELSDYQTSELKVQHPVRNALVVELPM